VNKRRGEEYKLLWRESPEFVRMASKCNALIVPFAAIGGALPCPSLALQKPFLPHAQRRACAPSLEALQQPRACASSVYVLQVRVKLETAGQHSWTNAIPCRAMMTECCMHACARRRRRV
jgi:hypothetical protein